MPRRGFIAKREVLADPLYNSVVVTKLINNIMLDGKRGVAQRIVYDAFEIIAEKRARTRLKCSSRRWKTLCRCSRLRQDVLAAQNYQVPIEVRPDRRQTLGLRWLTLYARQRGERTMRERLANEIMDAVNGTGGAVKKREDTQKWRKQTKRLLTSVGNLNFNNYERPILKIA